MIASFAFSKFPQGILASVLHNFSYALPEQTCKVDPPGHGLGVCMLHSLDINVTAGQAGSGVRLTSV
ncbi:hypothetical protein PGTUg99_035632 [Puccinia graminis f. sp. tritici]|uniref:Uncharacterized protein n=1 Tax=Puccinia graminis f. sp. tritici TaxID=56615 RepID=A0A5B0Q9K1_PUCGR|nr:hypothetical protein PGTUg99_035632 [Puccinia graminis f. sp. tritici]